MDGLALLAQAREAGLKVIVADGHLRIKGPRRHALLSRQLIENKAEVIAAIEMGSATDEGAGFHPLDHGTGTKTLKRPAFEEVLGPSTSLTQQIERGTSSFDMGAVRHRLIGNGFPPHPVAAVPDAIHAVPKGVCPVCGVDRVLSELRTITGGQCYSCWEQEVRP